MYEILKKLKNQTAIAACLTGAVSLVPSMAYAQLDEIVVTAKKREANLQDVPISVGVVDADTLDKAQFSDFREISRLSPSVNFQGGFTPSATNFNIRGVGSYAITGGVQPSVSLNIDGVPLARAGEFITDLADIERIEVLRGPQGTLFGRNSTGGAINITRKRPTEEFEGSVEVGASTDDEYFGRAVISGPISENVRGRLVGLYLDREGHVENFGPASSGGNLGGIETFALSGKLDIDLSPDFNVLLSAEYSDRQHGFSPQIADIPEVLRGILPGGADFDPTFGARALVLGGGDAALGQAILADPFATAISIVGDENENITLGFSADATYDISDSVQFKSITSYREFSDDNNPDIDGTQADGDNLGFPIINVATSQDIAVLQGGPDSPSRQVDSDYFTQEFRLEGTQDQFDWTAGAFYQDYSESLINSVSLLIIDSFNPALGNGAAVGGTATANDEYVLQANFTDNTYGIDTYALFGEVNYHVSDRVDVFAGLRWTSETINTSLNNTTTIAPIPIANIPALFDSNTGILDITGFPVYPGNGGAPNPESVGTVSETEDFFSYRAGISFDATDTTNVYASVSRGNVGPGASQSFDSTVSTVFLEPTTADSYEIGIKSELFDNRVRLNMAGFITDITDLQSSALIPGTVTTRTLNAGDLKINGIEVDATFAASDRITFSAGVVLLDHEIRNLQQGCFIDQLTAGTGCTIDNNGDMRPDAQDVSGSPATNTPDTSLNLSANYNYPTKSLPFDFFAYANYSYKSRVQFALNQDDLASQEGFGILDLTVGITDKDGRYEFQLYGKNVTDQFYVADAFEAFGALGRRVIRTPRGARGYYGAKLKVNF